MRKRQVYMITNMDFGKELKIYLTVSIYSTDKYYEASENNDFIVCVYLDLSAFDTISHDIHEKRSVYGFRGKTHDWIEYNLSGRKQFVFYDDI